MYYLIIAMAMIVVLGTIGTGITMLKSKAGIKLPSGKTLTYASVITYLLVFGAFVVMFVPGAVHAATDTTSASNGLAYLAAGISTGLAAIGAGFAVASSRRGCLGSFIGRSESIRQNPYLYRPC
jgi:V/A-type H+-transporting ATPase subunit K